MDINNKKFVKKTNQNQFQKLVELMEEYPQLATGSPTFGSSRVAVDETWDNVAKQINYLGPPVRIGLEWKRVWQDQKCRVKKKISENNKSIYGTGGGPCTVNNLTELEEQIDRICHLSSAAAPGGTVLGLPSAHKPFEFTPPRRNAKIAVVTPTSSKQMDVNKKTQPEDASDIYTDNIPNITIEHSYISPILTTEHLHQSLPPSQQQTTSTPKIVNRPLHQNRKRKHTENTSDRLQLLHQQNEIQKKTLEIMNKHAEAAKVQAEAAKLQAEAAKVQAEASQDQAKALKEIAEATKIMGKALQDIIKHLKDDD